MATLSDTGKPLTPFGMPSSWIPQTPAPTVPKVTAPATPPWQPQPEQSLAWLSGVNQGSTAGGQNIWNPLEGRWQQIAPESSWGSIPNQGMIVGNASSITPERAAQMGLTWDPVRQGWGWNPSSDEQTQMQNYWASPEGKAMLGQYSQTGGDLAGSPTGGAPAGGYNMYNPNTGAVSPYSGAYPGQGAGGGTPGTPGAQGQGASQNKVTVTMPDGTKVTGPANSPQVQAALAAGADGAGTGGNAFNYPMNPLGDAASQPNIQSQNSLLAMMQQDPYLSGILQPFLNQAYSAIGQSGMPTSSYTDQMLANIIAPMYLANQQNVLGGYANLSPQLQGLAQTSQEPYQTLMNYILSF